MRTIAHISDLHFGRIQPRSVEALIDALARVAPDLTVVSGDLTQRARHSQFRQARAFLDAVPGPHLAVPGNHDVPLYNAYRRFRRPLKRFERHITAEKYPFFQDEEIAALGVNTARSLTFTKGRVNRTQAEAILARFARIGDTRFTILVSHHPFLPPPGTASALNWGRTSLALDTVRSVGVDMLLAGHHHKSHLGFAPGDGPQEQVLAQGRTLVLHAGTATSSRMRGEENAFNIIRIMDRDAQGVLACQVDRYALAGAAFELRASDLFERKDLIWRGGALDSGPGPR